MKSAVSDPLDLVSKLTAEERAEAEFRMNCISPDDGKYGKSTRKLKTYLTHSAEILACAKVQRVLLETRIKFKKAKSRDLELLDKAIPKINPLNVLLIEEQITRHDQLAILEELGRYMPEHVKALLHPGTTSYDILDTARAFLFRNAWNEFIRPEVGKTIEELCELSVKAEGILQVGRTHLQNTSPVPLDVTLAGYAARLADRTELIDKYSRNLRGKISGIVGTGASIEMVIGRGKSRQFEDTVLKKLGLISDKRSTQITQKEALADFGHGLVTLYLVLADFANDVRMMYSSAIREVVSRDSAARLGGSSADAGKDNPIHYENNCGKAAMVVSGMTVLYSMISSDFQRDLRGSVQARYQPQLQMAQTYEAFGRMNKSLKQFSVNTDTMAKNLVPVRRNPSEAMTAILRGEQWVHSEHGVGHDFVKEMAKRARKSGRGLLYCSMRDGQFRDLFDTLPGYKQRILRGELELYTGHSLKNAKNNLEYAREVARLN